MTDTANKEFDQNEWQKMFDKVGEGSFNFRDGLPCLNNNEVLPQWDEAMSDWLFCVGGVSMFFSSLAYRAKFHWTWAIPTAGAWVHGGKLHVAFNPYFMMNVIPTTGQRVFVLLHEVMHLIHDHTVRCVEQALDRSEWNKACDFYINYQLERFASMLTKKRGMMEFIPKEVFPLCYDVKYADWTEMEIYKDLMKNKKDSDEGEGEGEGSGGQKSLDDFSDYGNESGDNDMGDARNTIYKAIREAETAMKSSNRPPGAHEIDLIRSIISSTETKVDWKDVLGEYVVQNSDELITYTKVSRRSTANVIFPVRSGDSIRMFFGFDTSGSMSMPELEDASGGVRQVAELFTNYHITLATADTRAHLIGTIDTLDGTEDFDPKNIEIKGGGGTRMSPLVTMAQEISDNEGVEFDVIIIFTDGELRSGDIDDVHNGDTPLVILVTEQGSMPSIESAEKIIQLN
jgi:predicted metal-dependent peptidase